MFTTNSKMFKIVVDETFKKPFGYPNLYEIANDKALLYIINHWKQIEKQIDKDWDIDYKLIKKIISLASSIKRATIMIIKLDASSVIVELVFNLYHG